MLSASLSDAKHFFIYHQHLEIVTNYRRTNADVHALRVFMARATQKKLLNIKTPFVEIELSRQRIISSHILLSIQ